MGRKKKTRPSFDDLSAPARSAVALFKVAQADKRGANARHGTAVDNVVWELVTNQGLSHRDAAGIMGVPVNVVGHAARKMKRRQPGGGADHAPSQ